VVLVVSGRPQELTDQLGDIDALVASWLPGSEGAGVADVLFGQRPFTGRLPMTWPRTEAQVPINVGDADYDPLFPYGWGLRTGTRRG
jgi:beta-glucosidase